MKIGTPDGDYLTNEVEEITVVSPIKATNLLVGMILAGPQLPDGFHVDWIEQPDHSGQVKFGASDKDVGITASFYIPSTHEVSIYIKQHQLNPLGELLQEMRDAVHKAVEDGVPVRQRVLLTYLIRMGEQVAKLTGTKVEMKVPVKRDPPLGSPLREKGSFGEFPL